MQANPELQLPDCRLRRWTQLSSGHQSSQADRHTKKPFPLAADVTSSTWKSHLSGHASLSLLILPLSILSLCSIRSQAPAHSQTQNHTPRIFRTPPANPLARSCAEAVSYCIYTAVTGGSDPSADFPSLARPKHKATSPPIPVLRVHRRLPKWRPSDPFDASSDSPNLNTSRACCVACSLTPSDSATESASSTSISTPFPTTSTACSRASIIISSAASTGGFPRPAGSTISQGPRRAVDDCYWAPGRVARGSSYVIRNNGKELWVQSAMRRRR